MNRKELDSYLEKLDDITSQIVLFAEETDVNEKLQADLIDSVEKAKKNTAKDIKYCKRHYVLSKVFLNAGLVGVASAMTVGKINNKKSDLISFILALGGVLSLINVGYEDAKAIIAEGELEHRVNRIITRTQEAMSSIKWAKEPDETI